MVSPQSIGETDGLKDFIIMYCVAILFVQASAGARYLIHLRSFSKNKLGEVWCYGVDVIPFLFSISFRNC
jgi:hypothetical protein